jgi:hypothetical protein
MARKHAHERIPRTWAEVQQHPAVSETEVWEGEECKYWVFLRNGYTAASEPGLLHQGNGRTIREVIGDVFPVQRCTCDDCTYTEQQRAH